MAKKRKVKKDKELVRLRREVELLRAQLKTRESFPNDKPLSLTTKKANQETQVEAQSTKEDTETAVVTANYIRANLRRSLILASTIVILILGLYFSQKFWLFIFGL